MPSGFALLVVGLLWGLGWLLIAEAIALFTDFDPPLWIAYVGFVGLVAAFGGLIRFTLALIRED